MQTSGYTQVHKRVVKLMGCRFEICIADPNPGRVADCMDYVVREMILVEKLLTTFDEGSQTNLINKNAGIGPVKVHNKVYDLVEYSILVSKLTGGAFDITYGSLHRKFWNFDLDMTSLPFNNQDQHIKKIINYRNIELDPEKGTVFLKEKRSMIGFGGIAKGYVADFAADLLKKKGIKSGIINASGDIKAWGKAPGKDYWTIGIKDPLNPGKMILNVKVSDGAVATSGNYEKYIKINETLFSHTIDTTTGYPVAGLKSISILAPTAVFADAMATAVGVMGVEAGITMINNFQNIHCFIMDNNCQLHFSENFSDRVGFAI